MSFTCCPVFKYFKVMWHKNNLGKNRFKKKTSLQFMPVLISSFDLRILEFTLSRFDTIYLTKQ